MFVRYHGCFGLSDERDGWSRAHLQLRRSILEEELVVQAERRKRIRRLEFAFNISQLKQGGKDRSCGMAN